MPILDIFKRKTRGWRTSLTQAPNALPPAFLNPPDAELTAALDKLKARSRDSVKNNGFASGYVNTVMANVLGSTGLQLSTPNQQALDAWNSYIETNVDYLEFDDWKSLEASVLRQLIVDGEAVVKIIYSDDHPHGIQLDVLDSVLLSSNANGVLGNSNNQNVVTLGVEKNPDGKVVAYHIVNPPFSPGGLGASVGYNTDQKTTRVSAERILHVFRKDQPDQSRGVPWMSSCIVAMQNLQQYVTSSLNSARMASKTLGFIETTRETQWEPDDENNTRKTLSTSNGAINTLAPNEKFSSWSPPFPIQGYSEFVKSQLHQIAAGTSISFAALTKDLSGTSFSAARVGLIADVEQYKLIRELLVSRFHKRFYKMWLLSAIRNGILPLPQSGNIEEYLKDVHFDGPSVQPLQPREASRAQELDVKLGVRSRSEIIRGDNRIPSEVFAELQREADIMRNLEPQKEESDVDSK